MPATHTSGQTLDWIFTGESDNVIRKIEVHSVISVIHCSIKLAKPPLPIEVHTYQSYKSLDPAKLLAKEAECDLDQNPVYDLDGLIRQYNTASSTIIDKHAPLKTRIMTVQPVTPWYSSAIHATEIVRCKNKMVL